MYLTIFSAFCALVFGLLEKLTSIRSPDGALSNYGKAIVVGMLLSFFLAVASAVAQFDDVKKQVAFQSKTIELLNKTLNPLKELKVRIDWAIPAATLPVFADYIMRKKIIDAEGFEPPDSLTKYLETKEGMSPEEASFLSQLMLLVNVYGEAGKLQFSKLLILPLSQEQGQAERIWFNYDASQRMFHLSVWSNWFSDYDITDEFVSILDFRNKRLQLAFDGSPLIKNVSIPMFEIVNTDGRRSIHTKFVYTGTNAFSFETHTSDDAFAR